MGDYMNLHYTDEQIQRAVDVLFTEYVILNLYWRYNAKGKCWLVLMRVWGNKHLQYTFYSKKEANLFIRLIGERAINETYYIRNDKM